MLKNYQKPSFRITPNSARHRDWKDHPLVVATLAVAGTSIFFMTVVLPLRVDLLSSQVERLTELSTNASRTLEQLEKTKEELVKTQAALAKSTVTHPFSGRSIYPIAYDSVVIGTPIEELLKRLPGGTWDEDNTYYSVDLTGNSTFSSATYYFHGSGSIKKVTGILFQLQDSRGIGEDIIRKHLLATYGEPTSIQKRAQIWKVSTREEARLQELVPGIGYTYHVGTP